MNSMRKNLLIIYASILAVGTPYLVWCLATGLRIKCGLYERTGIQCPACGATRMFVSLAKLRFEDAFNYNAFFFIAFFVWNLIAVFLFWGKPAFVQKPWFLYTGLFVSVAAMILFGILRNFC